MLIWGRITSQSEMLVSLSKYRPQTWALTLLFFVWMGFQVWARVSYMAHSLDGRVDVGSSPLIGQAVHHADAQTTLGAQKTT